MHLRAAQRLVVGLLTRGHLHQRRATEKNLGLLAHHHRVVAHARHVGATGRGVAEHQGDGGLLGRRATGDVAEQLAARDEDLLLRGQVRTTGLHQGDRRQAVLLGDLGGTEDLLDRPRVARAALHSRVVGGDQALDALDHPDAGHHARAHREVGTPAGQRAELQERRALVDQQLDPLAGQQLAPVVVASDVLLTTAGHRLRVLGLQVGELLEHRLAVGSTHAGASSTVFIRSSVVRMPRSLVRPRSRPRIIQ